MSVEITVPGARLSMQDRFSREVIGMSSSSVQILLDRIQRRKALHPSKKTGPKHLRKTRVRKYGKMPIDNAAPIPSSFLTPYLAALKMQPDEADTSLAFDLFVSSLPQKSHRKMSIDR